MRGILFLIFGLLIVQAQNSAIARESWRNDTAMLPQYCQDRAKGHTKGPFTKWRKVFGKTYVHVHHYCSGIYAEYKSKGMVNGRARDKWLSAVVNEMSYVSRNCGVGCVLYPELHTRWGRALGEQGNVSEAIQHFRLAIKAKPTYIAAYSGLSDLYKNIDKRDDAQKVLKEGLKVKPESRALRRRLDKLEQ